MFALSWLLNRLMQSDNSSFDLSGDALVLGDWLLPALGEGRCWLFGILTAREFGLLRSCHFSSVKKDSMENSVTKPFRFDLSQSQQFNLNSTKVQSFNLDLNFYVPIFLPSLSFLRIWMVLSKHGELTSEIFNLLPELWHQAFCDVMEPSAAYEINLLCQWCSRAYRRLGIYWGQTICHIVIRLVIADSKMMNALNGAE